MRETWGCRKIACGLEWKHIAWIRTEEGRSRGEPDGDFARRIMPQVDNLLRRAACTHT